MNCNQHEDAHASTVRGKLLTPKKAAAHLAVSERTLYNLTAPRGPIECIRIRRSLRYSIESLVKFIESRKVKEEPNENA